MVVNIVEMKETKSASLMCPTTSRTRLGILYFSDFLEVSAFSRISFPMQHGGSMALGTKEQAGK
jgi:hypothetical protein